MVMLCDEVYPVYPYLLFYQITPHQSYIYERAPSALPNPNSGAEPEWKRWEKRRCMRSSSCLVTKKNATKI